MKCKYKLETKCIAVHATQNWQKLTLPISFPKVGDSAQLQYYKM